MADCRREPGRLIIIATLIRVGFIPPVAFAYAAMGYLSIVMLGVPADAWTLLFGALGVLSSVAWMCYGIVVNDYYDQGIDAHHPFANKVFTRGHFSEAGKRRCILATALVAGLGDAVLLARIAATHTDPLQDALAYCGFTALFAFLATEYSAPPLRMRQRLLGAAPTLMLMFPAGFVRMVILLGSAGALLGNWAPVAAICLYYWVTHGITSVSLKDISDILPDRKGGVRSVPIVFGLRPALHLSMAFLVASLALGCVYVLLGWVEWWFLLTNIGAAAYLYLYRDLDMWIGKVSSDESLFSKLPMRVKFHKMAYSVSFGIWVPLFTIAFARASF